LTLQQYGIELPETESEVKELMKEVTRQQENTLMMILSIHGAHHKTLESDGIAQCSSHIWLKDGRVQVSTKALIMAAQVRGIVTKKYLSEV